MNSLEARIAAVRFLSRREHSEKELAGKLLRKGVSQQVVTEVIARLRSESLVSNERFTEQYVQVRTRRGFGPVKIRLELKERGIDPSIIEDWVEVRDQRWVDQCAKAMRHKYGETRIEDYKEWARRARFLQGRGFTSDQISAALDSRY